MRWLIALFLLVAAPTVWGAAATSGGACTLRAPAGNTSGPPATTCTVLCSIVTDASAWTCGPVYVPQGGAGVAFARIAVALSSAAGCDYDDFSVYELDESTVSANTVIHLLGVLDDDGSGGGVTQIRNFGPLGPYLYLAGGVSGTLGTCSAPNPLEIRLETWLEQSQR